MRLVNQKIVHERVPKTPSSLTPLGICRFEDGAAGLITAYEPDILSYDNLFWTDNGAVQTPERIRKALGHCGTALGRLHAQGFVHGDAQIKNMAADNHGVRYVDLEDLLRAPIHEGGAINGGEFGMELQGELERFVGSLTARSEDYEQSYGTELDEAFWPIYTAELKASPHEPVRTATLDVLQPIMHGDAIL